MRSAILAVAFAAGVIAVPHGHKHKRDTVVDVDVVYVTDIVTVTAGSEPTATSSVDSNQQQWWGHWSWSEETSTAPAVAQPTTTSVATSTWVAPTTSAAPSSTSVAPVASSSSAPSSTDSGSTSVPSTYSQKVVLSHNVHRANHSASNIAWSDSLAASAQTIAESCVYAHNTAVDGGGYGQNIAAGVPSDNVTAIITDLFYNGEVEWFVGLYNQAQPSMVNFEHWGHFSQIVWKDTTQVGCATVDCSSQGLANVGSDVAPYFTVCNYGPPGNYANEYGANIGEPLNYPTVQWNYGL